MSDLLFKDECYKIVGACFEVYNTMGCGFLEAVYQECLEIELVEQSIPFTAHPDITLKYRNRELKQHYIPDFVCFDSIIVEIKATKTLADEHRAQLINYLHATGYNLGLLINFGHYPGIQYERIVRNVNKQGMMAHESHE